MKDTEDMKPTQAQIEAVESPAQRERNEIIERCAQVADRLMVPGVAEEIRALKDKP